MAAPKPRTPIQLPPKTIVMLENLINQQQLIQAQINAVLATARDLLNVPDDFVLQSLAVGFEPPAAPPAE